MLRTLKSHQIFILTVQSEGNSSIVHKTVFQEKTNSQTTVQLVTDVTLQDRYANFSSISKAIEKFGLTFFIFFERLIANLFWRHPFPLNNFS